MAVKAMDMETVKERCLTALDKLQTNQTDWFTVSDVARKAGLTTGRARPALYSLAVEGFLHIRHDPAAENMLRYRVRRNGDDPQ